MTVLSENIKTHRKQNHLSQKELAILLKVAPTAVSAWEVGRNQPRIQHIQEMTKLFQISPAQLLGEHEMLSQNENKTIKDLDPQMEILEEALYEVTVTTKLAAGIGYAFNDYDQEKVTVANQPPRYDLASFVYGDSMEPKYHSGDIVYLVDKGLSSYSGEVCAIAYEGKTYIKRVYTEAGYLRLESLNPKYDDIFIDFPPQDGSYIRIYEVVGTDSTIPA